MKRLQAEKELQGRVYETRISQVRRCHAVFRREVQLSNTMSRNGNAEDVLFVLQRKAKKKPNVFIVWNALVKRQRRLSK